MKHKILSVLFLICFSPSGWAQGLITTDLKCVCDKNLQDPLETPVKFNFGKFAGQCIDSCRFRSVKVLTNTDEKMKDLKPDDFIIGNFLHLSKYYIAVIPKNAVLSVEVGFEEFRPKIHHIFTRYILNPKTPVRLYSQDPKREFVGTVDSVIISSEGVPAVNQPYSLLESFMENYILIDRVTSMDEVKMMNQSYKHYLKFYALEIRPEQGDEMLRRGLVKSQKQGFDQVYKLFSSNCSTSALSLLDSVIQYPVVSYLKMVEEALPIESSWGLLQALRDRKVLRSNVPVDIINATN